MKNLIYIILFLLGLKANAQSVSTSLSLPSVVLLDIEPSNSNITLSYQTPTEAGNPLGAANSDNSKWINFTSAVAPNVTRFVSAQIISGGVSSGLRLKLATSGASGGAGSRGNANSPIYLSNTASTIINNIGGGYTGNGAGSGYNLLFSLEIQDYSQLRGSSNTLTVMYTISDN